MSRNPKVNSDVMLYNYSWQSATFVWFFINVAWGQKTETSALPTFLCVFVCRPMRVCLYLPVCLRACRRLPDNHPIHWWTLWVLAALCTSQNPQPPNVLWLSSFPGTETQISFISNTMSRVQLLCKNKTKQTTKTLKTKQQNPRTELDSSVLGEIPEFRVDLLPAEALGEEQSDCRESKLAV